MRAGVSASRREQGKALVIGSIYDPSIHYPTESILGVT
jgi:hypothetical protein